MRHQVYEACGLERAYHDEEADEEQDRRPLDLVQYLFDFRPADEHSEGGPGKRHDSGVEACELLEKEANHRRTGHRARADQERSVLDLFSRLEGHYPLAVLLGGVELPRVHEPDDPERDQQDNHDRWREVHDKVHERQLVDHGPYDYVRRVPDERSRPPYVRRQHLDYEEGNWIFFENPGDDQRHREHQEYSGHVV